MRRGLIVGLGVCAFIGGACSASGGAGTSGRSGSGGFAADGGLAASGGSAADAGVAASGGTAANNTGGTGNIAVAGGTGGDPGTGGTGGDPSVGGTGAGGSGAGCGVNIPTDQPASEACDGLDNDLNGFVDEGCPCNLGQQQECFGGYPSQQNSANCHKGTQTCGGTPEFKSWGPCENWGCDDLPPVEEVCGNTVDDDCDGLTDEGCALNVPVHFNGDCLMAACPQQAPYPIGCNNITFAGNDPNGCVSTAPGNGLVYFQEGNACCIPFIPTDCGNVQGTLICSSQPGAPLDQVSCPMNKTAPLYPTSGGPGRWGCPT